MVKKDWLKSTSKETGNLIKNKTFLIEEPSKGEPVTPRMSVYKAKIQYDGNIYKLKLRVVVIVDLQNEDMIGNTWSPT